MVGTVDKSKKTKALQKEKEKKPLESQKKEILIDRSLLLKN